MKTSLKNILVKVLETIKTRIILTKDYRFSNLAQYASSGTYYMYIPGIKAKAGLPSTATIISASMSGWSGLGTNPNVNLANDDALYVTYTYNTTISAAAYITVRFAYILGGVLRNAVIATLSAISKIGGGVNEGCHKETVIKGADESAGTVVSSHAAKRRQPEQSYRILGNGSVLYTSRREQFTSRMGNAAGDWRHRYFTDNIQCERYICTHVHGKPVDLGCVEEVCSGKLATSERRCAA